MYRIAGVPEPQGVDAGYTVAPERAAATGAASTSPASGAATDGR